jgi:BlaI family transcriptional regulator, penicillinase repressor
VATLVRILADKQFLAQTNQERPFAYRATRSHEDVSRKLLGELLDRVFRGSREQLLVRLMEQKALTVKERALLADILGQKEKRR